MTPGEVRRLYFIIRTFLSYGLDELIPKMRITLPLRLWRYSLFWMPNRHKDKLLGERLRLALQELGPVWIKFGQMLSTRRDLLPPDIAEELAMLQDRVPPSAGRRPLKIEESSGFCPVETLVRRFRRDTPLASASIAQVHTGRLKENGREIVIKVIRPDIEPVIEADLRPCRPPGPPGGPFRTPEHAPAPHRGGGRVSQDHPLDELNLMREAANAIQLRRNFTGSDALYVPEVFTGNTAVSMLLVMERIYGIPVSDIPALEANGTNMKLLAERGVEVFFTQVFRDSFFHADMHPGNVFVSYEHPDNPLWIGIDCGIVGTLNREAQRCRRELPRLLQPRLSPGGGAACGVWLGTTRYQGG
ncbi:AarF/UbiB family protein [Escherichia coli]